MDAARLASEREPSPPGVVPGFEGPEGRLPQQGESLWCVTRPSNGVEPPGGLEKGVVFQRGAPVTLIPKNLQQSSERLWFDAESRPYPWFRERESRPPGHVAIDIPKAKPTPES